jgi:dTDP-glucose 4,6-dehydratase
MTMAYHSVHGVDTKIVRIFNTFGPRMRARDGRCVPAFINQALNDEPITVFGPGTQTRSFCYVSDLITGIVALAKSRETGPVNIGNPQEMTVVDLARRIVRLTGSRSQIVFKPLPVDDPKVRQPDITLARKALGWQPVVDLDTGLSATIAYFKSQAPGR